MENIPLPQCEFYLREIKMFKFIKDNDLFNSNNKRFINV